MEFWTPIVDAHQLPPIGTEESETLDFKDKPWAGSDSQKNELARDVAQFANNLGGSIILGACEDGSNRLTEYVSVEHASVVAQRIIDVCYGALSPRFEIDSRVLKAMDREVVVVNVPPSDGVVAIKLTGVERWEFFRRIGKGKKHISFEEVEAMWTEGRRGRVILSKIPAGSRGSIWLDVIQGLHVSLNRNFANLILEKDWFLLEFSANRFNFPYEFVRAAWPRAGGGWAVSLNLRIDADHQRNLIPSYVSR